MVDPITRTQLENASRDADDLGKIVNGTAVQSPVDTRTGGPVKTVQKILDEIAGGLTYAKGNAVVDAFFGDGATTSFALSADPGTRANVQVVVSGVVQRQKTEATSFSLTYPGGTPTIVMVTAPPQELDDVSAPIKNVEIRYGSVVAVNVPADDSVTAAKINGAGAAAILTKLGISLYDSASYLVILAGTAAKTTVVDADKFYMSDSAASGAPKWITWANLKSAILTYVQAQLDALLNQTGQFAYFDRATAPGGWVIANGGTIGNAASGGTTRANADTEALFTLIWTEFNQTDRPVKTSAGAASTRGASAAADYAANKRIPLADPRGRVIRALDLSKGIDTGRALGTVQNHQLQGHIHLWGTGGGTALGGSLGNGTGVDYLVPWANSANGVAQSGFAKGPTTDGVNGTVLSGAETRMTNYAALCCIKL